MSHATKKIKVGDLIVGGGSPLVLIAGPCVVENRDMVLKTARTIQKVAQSLNTPLIFKSSYRKANRTSRTSFSGIGDEKALSILQEVKRELGIPILTDIHLPTEASVAAEVADVLQIPAFLCRQTELLQAAGKTGKVVNIKKGQFLSPAEMKLAAEKVETAGNKNILLTERGTTFGYNNLVVDMRSLSIMRATGYPVVLDATHSVQLPGGKNGGSGGQPEFIFPIARAGVAAGCDALFVETHPNPAKAWSDAESQLKLDLLADLLKQVVAIDRTVRQAVFSST
ncbi:MAG: 3-deoxy-8-phosphooctulonate synthase [Ignavibacteriales bacterium]|nr:3-deoxy-8-phosphooctulonate synthase [Ignavibacteriales bacterium]